MANTHDVALSGGTVALNDGAGIETATDSVLNGATITLTAIDSVSLSGTGGDASSSGMDAKTSGDGAAGKIRIEAPLIELQEKFRLC